MKVKDIVDTAKKSVLINLPVVNDESVILQFVYMGVSDLYRKFGLSIKSGNINTTSTRHLYTIEDEDLNILINIYDGQGNKFEDSDVSDKPAEYKRLNYNSFILAKPVEGFITYIYLASPKPINSIDDEIKLPNCMMSALMHYIGYLAHSTVVNTQAGDTLNPSNTFLQAYEIACRELEKVGYNISINNESRSSGSRGFV